MMKRIFTLFLLLSVVITFAQPVEETIITGNFPNPAAIETLDFNQNGQEDIIVAGGGTIRWYENDNGGFIAHDIIDSLNSIWDFDLVDFNGNAELDIVAINDYSNTLFWLENDGNMNFTYHVLTDTLVDLEQVKAIDANQNGLVDIFFTIYDGSYFKLYMWENTGTGFDAKYVDRIDYRDIYLFDYEDDGDDDARDDVFLELEFPLLLYDLLAIHLSAKNLVCLDLLSDNQCPVLQIHLACNLRDVANVL
jgi:hypothetical protein